MTNENGRWDFVRDALKDIQGRLEHLETRLRHVERFNYKVVGAMGVLVTAGNLFVMWVRTR